MTSMMKWIALSCGAALVLGCSSVTLKPSAKEVEILEKRRVAKCERLGTTQVSVSTQVGFIARSKSAIESDLKVLARNSGHNMGGDTVSPVTEVSDGQQTYGVYDCIDE